MYPPGRISPHKYQMINPTVATQSVQRLDGAADGVYRLLFRSDDPLPWNRERGCDRPDVLTAEQRVPAAKRTR